MATLEEVDSDRLIGFGFLIEVKKQLEGPWMTTGCLIVGGCLIKGSTVLV